ncbi:MAG: hypothetical protein KM310_00810 [Clostridiales bacterium]|nr:hypothetical protein [Clostridiales bacterium]
MSRRLVAATERKLADLLALSLGDLDLVVLMINGIVLAEHTVVCASGIDRGG